MIKEKKKGTELFNSIHSRSKCEDRDGQERR
jgi:hypothetical protein